MSRNGDKKKPVGFATHITAGGIAGAMEAVSTQLPLAISIFFHSSLFNGASYSLQLACQPLDTIKVRMQLSKSGLAPGVSLLLISLSNHPIIL